jgi:hypothetical protein
LTWPVTRTPPWGGGGICAWMGFGSSVAPTGIENPAAKAAIIAMQIRNNILMPRIRQMASDLKWLPT